MKIEIGPRQSGKTLRLIEQAAKNDGLIICPDSRAARHVERMAKQLGMKIRKPVSISQFKHGGGGLRGTTVKEVYVDNADVILYSLIGRWIHTATFSGRGNKLIKAQTEEPTINKRKKADQRKVEV